MKDDLIKLMNSSPESLELELANIASVFEIQLPEKVHQLISKIKEIQSYKNIDNFYKNAPEELCKPQLILELSDFVDYWNKLISKRDELAHAAKFLTEAVLPPGNFRLSFMAKTLSAMAESIFTSPLVDEFIERFEALLCEYTAEYLKFHVEHNRNLEKLSDKIDELKSRLEIICALAEIELLKNYCEIKDREEFELLLPGWEPCKYIPKAEDIEQEFVCPECHRTFTDAGIITVFDDIYRKWETVFLRCMRALSYNLSKVILESEKDPLKSLLDSVAVSDLSKIRSIMSPELLERIKKILGQSSSSE